MSKVTRQDEITVDTTLDQSRNHRNEGAPAPEAFVSDSANLLEYLSAIFASPQPKINFSDTPFEYTPDETTSTGNPIVDGVIHFGAQHVRAEAKRLRTENDALRMKVARLTADLNEAECSLEAVFAENDELKLQVSRLESELDAQRVILSAEPAVEVGGVEAMAPEEPAEVFDQPETAAPAEEADLVEEAATLDDPAPSEEPPEPVEDLVAAALPEPGAAAEALPFSERFPEPELFSEPEPELQGPQTRDLAADAEPAPRVTAENEPDDGGYFFPGGEALVGSGIVSDLPRPEPEAEASGSEASPLHSDAGDPSAPVTYVSPPREAEGRPVAEPRPEPEPPVRREAVAEPSQPRVNHEPKPQPREPAHPGPRFVAVIPPRPKHSRVIRADRVEPAEPAPQPEKPKPVFQPLLQEAVPPPPPEEPKPEPVPEAAETDPERSGALFADAVDEPEIEPAPVTKVVARKHIDHYRQIQQEAEAGETGASHDSIGKA